MTRALSYVTVLLALSLGACMQTENSSSQDRDTYSDVGGSTGFTAARTVLSQNCANCHDFGSVTEATLISRGDIVAGNPENSKIYYRLVGSSGANGPKNMPTGGTLNNTDLETIKSWIQNAN